ncbi:unnamed protein product [Gadus morhua 'NCC']
MDMDLARGLSALPSSDIRGAPSPHQSHFQQLAVVRNQHASTSSPTPQKLTILDRNIIYAITCSQCHIIYVGDTKPTILTKA